MERLQMDKTPATSGSWKTNAMPQEKKLFELELVLSAEEFQQVQLGHMPEEMEDKWFIYFEDGWLNLHRSWTGNCIYRLRFERYGDAYRVVEAWVNRSLTEYKFTDDEHDRQLVTFLIGRLLLRENSSPPRGGETQA